MLQSVCLSKKMVVCYGGIFHLHSLVEYVAQFLAHVCKVIVINSNWITCVIFCCLSLDFVEMLKILSSQLVIQGLKLQIRVVLLHHMLVG